MKLRSIMTDILAGDWRHAKQRCAQAYADWRVGATVAEAHCYTQGGRILLTFDDYADPTRVRDLLALLKQLDVQAMFFIQGDWADQHAGLMRVMSEAGHVVANHTYSHRNLLELSDDEVREEISRGPKSQWLRPPQGKFDQRIRQLAAELGYQLCYWTIDSDDWQGVSAAAMQTKIMAEVEPGAVILFHLHGRHTLEVLPGLVAAIRDRGFEVARLGEALWA
ncbi:MAG TPA: polysaccharide deacetylase family protein [Candidatus Saccharimonadia bacterium]